METQVKSMKTYAKLGFTHLETAEIVTNLNQLLANYHIHYQKLRNFHWNVVGQDFFDLHNKFEDEYRTVQENIDQIAERVRIFGKLPMSTLEDYMETSEIKEIREPVSPYEMVQEILADYEILLSFMMNTIEAAGEIGDTGTDDMITGFIRKMEKSHWMLSAWLKKA